MRDAADGPGGTGGIFLGLDAGGTRVRALAVEERGARAPSPAPTPFRQWGRVLGRGTGGPGNALSVSSGDLADHLSTAVAQALPAAAAARLSGVAAGFAGVSWLLADDPGRGAATRALRTALARRGVPGGVPVQVRSDVEVAFAAGPGASADGLLVLAGTGCAVVRFVAGQVAATVDAHGWLLDDAGSGHWIGRHAGRAVLRALDGRGPWTALVPAVAARLAAQPAGPSAEGTRALARELACGARPARRRECEHLRARLLTALLAQGARGLAGLCPVVVDAAERGDQVAAALLDDAARELTESVRALDPVPGETVVTTGGLLGPGGPLLPRLSRGLSAFGLRPLPVADGTGGAVSLARGVGSAP